MKITRLSPVTGIEHQMDLDITEEQYNEWVRGGLAQSVFANLSPSEREFIMTGIYGDEWDMMFGREDL
jgi:hypothetical protein